MARHQARAARRPHGDGGDQHRAGEQRHGAERAAEADLIRADAPSAGSIAGPSRNSTGGTLLKNRIASNSSDSTMPIVVRIGDQRAQDQEDVDHPLDLIAGAQFRMMRFLAKNRPAQARASMTTASAPLPISRR